MATRNLKHKMSEVSAVNFILGNRCNSKCSHCFARATPNSQSKLDEQTALNLANQIAVLTQIREIHFNGGEPFLYLPLMQEIAKIVSSKDPKIIKVATGAGEFKTYEGTAAMISRLPRLSELWVSIDNYHLEHIPLANYKNLDTICRQLPIRMTYSITYKTMSELAQTLKIIHSNEFKYDEIIKQPIALFGRATQVRNSRQYTDNYIPSDYRCGEPSIATIWTNGKITNCSAYSARCGLIERHDDFTVFLSKNRTDPYHNLRNSKSLSEIASHLSVTGPFDVTSPCASCKSILSKIQSNTKHSL